ncbi:PLC-like phosphodiesterase [Echria macrotheca]|uniref:PLC-like phosphodiesterase n=1 Tax=Echria macrotheca TaxID=438768 RepID=A0AAJ0BNY3_9PEZI|nr:PLC-like phosphodiesterase [Echria macrotheca]
MPFFGMLHDILSGTTKPADDKPHEKPPAIPESWGPMAFRNDSERDAIRELNNWTSKIDGKINVCQLSIPGTHDSHATYSNTNIAGVAGGAAWPAKSNPPQFKAFATTQILEIYQQLRAGVRYFDLRVGGDGNMRRGFVPLYMHLNDVLRYVHQYLTDPEHTAETVIISVMRDRGPDGSVHQIVKQKWDEYGWYSGADWPVLEQVRGKAILFRRFATDNGGEYGINGSAFYDEKDRLGSDKKGQWTQQDVQKDNEGLSIDEKWNSVWPHLDAALGDKNSNVMFFTGLATNGKNPFDWKEGEMAVLNPSQERAPLHFANRLNPRLLQELGKRRMDVDHCVKIIFKNFPQEVYEQSKSWVDAQRVVNFGNGIHIEFQGSDGHLVAYGPLGSLWAVDTYLPNKPASEGVKMHWSGTELSMFRYPDGKETQYFQAGPSMNGSKLRFIGGPPYMMIDTELEEGDGQIMYCSIPVFWLEDGRYGEPGYPP